tara:strand:+ start:7033 stop:8439 length:1407 start_codon:yes stop_codon:yes gene_type:complete
MIDIRQAMTDDNLFGAQFGADSFAAWRALLAGFYGLELSEAEQETFTLLTQRTEAPTGPFDELWLPIGRRGGKSLTAALLALYEGPFKDHRAKLAPGEVATCMVIAADRKQARAVMRYITGMVDNNPMLSAMVVHQNSEAIEFDNSTVIEVHTASHKAVRGYTLAIVIMDECAFWHVEGANPDKDIVTALRPALATLKGKLVALSSPYAKRGILWAAYKRYFATADKRVLVAQAPTLIMNPSLDPAIVEQALEEDREAAKAEYLAQFRGDISSFLDVELLEQCTRPKPLELPPARNSDYRAFVDPAGGGADEFTLSIGHKEGLCTVIDLVRGRKGSPAEIVAEYARILQNYGIRTVSGDRYAGRWPRDEFNRHEIDYEVSELDRSALYLESLAALNSGQVELPPCEKTKRQFASLERRTSRSGRDSIDHPPGGHDDRANAVAGVVAHMTQRKANVAMILRKRNRRVAA